VRKKTVLIVDNSEAIQSFLGNELSRQGYAVEKAYDGLEALQKVYSSPPDFILLDLIMPKIEGARVCMYLKEDERFRHIPIIILSGVAKEAEKTINTCRADAYIVKDRMETIIVHVIQALKKLEEKPSGEKPAILGLEQKVPRQLVRELLEIKNHYESILQSMAEGAIETDSLGKITYVNREALEILSLKEGDVIGKEIFSILDRKAAEKCLANASARESLTFAWGNKFIKVILSPILQDSNVIGLLTFLEDITERERLRTEVEETHRLLVQSEKLAATSKLAAGIAHEIKNPLNSLSFTVANIEQVINTSRNIKEAKRASDEHLALIRSDLERIKLLVDRFMSFARPRQIQLASKNVGAILRSAVNTIRLRAKDQMVDIIERYEDGILEVMVEEEELFRSFINLLTNSLEAMEGGGTITVSCSHSTENIIIRIADTGTGIPAEIQDKVFDIFFTTKERGSGLGLSQVYRTIESIGGKISLMSPINEGKGTEFSLHIPLMVKK